MPEGSPGQKRRVDLGYRELPLKARRSPQIGGKFQTETLLFPGLAEINRAKAAIALPWDDKDNRTLPCTALGHVPKH